MLSSAAIMKKIAVFASGNGSNAEALVRYFNKDAQKNAVVALVVTNRKSAGVINRLKPLGVPSFVFPNAEFEQPQALLEFLTENKIDLIVLAGFLRAIPAELIKMYERKIVNIHPALLPQYGGKGMYGEAVHKAIISNAEQQSGITIHYVNEEYDKGEIIFQAHCAITKEDTPETLAQKIHALEHLHFPQQVERILNKA